MLGSSSFAPLPNALSPVPLGRSKSAFSPDTFCQSVVPKVVGLVSRLPSPPAKVLPDSAPRQSGVPLLAEEKSQPPGRSARLTAGIANMMPSAAATTASHARLLLRNRRDPPSGDL